MREKSIVERLNDHGVSMADLFKGFIQAISELEDERSQDGDNAEEREEDVPPVDSYMEENLYHCEDFPGRKFFNLGDLNAEDPAFYRGVDIGIPEAVAVHSNEMQGRLYPFVEAVNLGEDY